MKYTRIVLSGRNNENFPRDVFWEDELIGQVIPEDYEGMPSWKAVDLSGADHGHWITDWFAAEALTRAPRKGRDVES